MQAVAYQPTYEADFSVIAIVIRILVEIVKSPSPSQWPDTVTQYRALYAVAGPQYEILS